MWLSIVVSASAASLLISILSILLLVVDLSNFRNMKIEELNEFHRMAETASSAMKLSSDRVRRSLPRFLEKLEAIDAPVRFAESEENSSEGRPSPSAIASPPSFSSDKRSFLFRDMPSFSSHNCNCESRVSACPRGATGLPGQPGIPGEAGYHGEEGRPGAPGVSIVDQEIPGCISCPPGPPGQPGEDGQPGDSGIEGPAGIPGRKGRSAPAGAAGPPGDPGHPGELGSPGPPGRPGDDGLRPLSSPGQPGPAGPPGVPGTPGESGEDASEGIQGSRGPPGPKGSTGFTGSTGIPGYPGRQGANGKDGAYCPCPPHATRYDIPSPPRSKTGGNYGSDQYDGPVEVARSQDDYVSSHSWHNSGNSDDSAAAELKDEVGGGGQINGEVGYGEAKRSADSRPNLRRSLVISNEEDTAVGIGPRSLPLKPRPLPIYIPSLASSDRQEYRRRIIAQRMASIRRKNKRSRLAR